MRNLIKSVGWLKILEPIIEKHDSEITKKITKDCKNRKTLGILPDDENVFRAFNECPYNELKVVIIGQDPYHTRIDGKPVADGLAFSSSVENYCPPSLKNILKVANPERTKVSLEDWAHQGVLLLNSALTVPRTKPSSLGAGAHTEIWKPFITDIIKAICADKSFLVFLLWGRKAQVFTEYIDSKHDIFITSHPSPYSYRGGFSECDHFNKVNEVFTSDKKINW